MAVQWTEYSTHRLIAIVRANPGLYSKINKMYKDTSAKNLAWESVGFSLTPPVSGQEAAKRFKSLFSSPRERRKEVASQPSSGAGTESSQYESSWEFYNDVLFLTEHIQPRRLISNFTNSNAPVAKAPKLSSNHVITEAVASSSCVVSQQHIASASPVSSQSASPQPIFLDTADYSFSIDVEDDHPYSSLPSPAPSSASDIRRKAMQSLQEPVAPKADSFRTKTEKEQQQLKNSLNQLTEVAVKAINKLNPTNTHNSHNDRDGPSCSSAMLVFALKQVPSDQQRRCMIDMLRVAEVYRKGGNAIISEEYST